MKSMKEVSIFKKDVCLGFELSSTPGSEMAKPAGQKHPSGFIISVCWGLFSIWRFPLRKCL